MEKVHAVVARSTFGSKKCQNTWGSDDFWKLRCRKSARRCGAKHILSKNGKLLHARATFGRSTVEKVHAIVAPSTSGVKSQNYRMLGPLLDESIVIRCRKSARRCGAKHISKSKVSKTEGFEPLLLCQMSFC